MKTKHQRAIKKVSTQIQAVFDIFELKLICEFNAEHEILEKLR